MLNKALVIGGTEDMVKMFDEEDKKILWDEVRTSPSMASTKALKQKYQLIILKFSICRTEQDKIVKQFSRVVDALSENATMLILEPSSEWAARAILAGDETTFLQKHIFGTESQKNRSMLSMMQLRKLCEASGLAITEATVNEYEIEKGVGAGMTTIMATKLPARDEILSRKDKV